MARLTFCIYCLCTIAWPAMNVCVLCFLGSGAVFVLRMGFFFFYIFFFHAG